MIWWQGFCKYPKHVRPPSTILEGAPVDEMACRVSVQRYGASHWLCRLFSDDANGKRWPLVLVGTGNVGGINSVDGCGHSCLRDSTSRRLARRNCFGYAACNLFGVWRMAA